jgi:hypothetical protein
MVNNSTIQWKACLGKCKQYFNNNAIAPLLMPASIKIATKGTYKLIVILRNIIEYGKGYSNAANRPTYILYFSI